MFKKGASGNPKGRPVGSKNRLPGVLQSAVHTAFMQRGGVKWLMSLDDETFARLLGKFVPRTLQEEGNRSVLVIDRVFVGLPPVSKSGENGKVHDLPPNGIVLTVTDGAGPNKLHNGE
jgi:hypothetical protein